MSKNRPSKPAHGGRVYSSQFAFQLTWKERVRALVGGHVHVTSKILVQPGASSIPTNLIKSVTWPRLPWSRRPETSPQPGEAA